MRRILSCPHMYTSLFTSFQNYTTPTTNIQLSKYKKGQPGLKPGAQTNDLHGSQTYNAALTGYRINALSVQNWRNRIWTYDIPVNSRMFYRWTTRHEWAEGLPTVAVLCRSIYMSPVTTNCNKDYASTNMRSAGKWKVRVPTPALLLFRQALSPD